LHILVKIESSCNERVTPTTGSSASAQAGGRNSSNFKRGIAAVPSRVNSLPHIGTNLQLFCC
jgi:hypothetical protein